ncbi:endothelin-1 [Bombina bombina]|uniref:endothelin-1 n=1 Tax=Bombina bombina TaxID=8345 RepID=UPI00235AFB2F|nr:endothelin-1 [Bombina bombina]
MDLHMVIYLLFVLFQGATGSGSIFLSEDGLPTSNTVEAASSRSSGSPSRLRRVKRCSCSSLMDKECVYFCHLDIIWINTPERTVPYGLGGPRMRRALQDTDAEKLPESTHRCSCAKSKDNTCLDFCQSAAKLRVQHSGKEISPAQQRQECNGVRFGARCIQKQFRSKKLQRSEGIEYTIKSSFAFANLMRKLRAMKQVTQHWTNKKRGIWNMKTTS